MQRTPVKKTGAIPKVKSSCQLCNAPDSICDMVQCDMCDKWFHFVCVGVSSSVKDLPWECSKCIKAQQKQIKSHQVGNSSKNNHLTQDLSVQVPHAVFNNGNTNDDIIKSTTKSPQQTKHDDLYTTNSHATGKLIQFTKPYSALLNLFDDSMVYGRFENPMDLISGNWNHQLNINASSSQPPPFSSSDKKAPSKSKCSTKASKASKLSTKMKLLEEEMKLKEEELKIQQELIQLKRKHIQQKSDLMEQYDSSSSSSSEDQTSVDNIENKVPQWLKEKNKCNPGSPPIHRKGDGVGQTRNVPEHEVFDNVRETNQLTMNEIAARNVIARELPIFSGNPKEWPMFISMYENTNMQCKFTNVENMVRLQRCLKGQALEAVQFQLFQPEMVDDVIKTLRMRFGRAEQIVANLIENIQRQPTLKDDNLQGIIKYSLSIKNLSAILESSQLYDQIRNPTLMVSVANKLPPHLKLQWSMFKRANCIENDVTEFSSWLYEIAKAANDVCPLVFSENSNQRIKGHVNVTQESSHHSSKTEMKQKEPSKCSVCEKEVHSIPDCKMFLSSSRNERWELVKKSNACKYCLRTNHHWSRCRLKRKCNVDNCQLRHHPLLHNNNNVASDEKKTDDKCHTEVSAHTNQNRRGTVYFRIVPIKVSGATGYIDTFAFLDDGSSITLIDQELADRLKLDGESQPLCLKWTGNESRLEKNSKQVTVDVLTSENKRIILNDVRTVSKLALPSQTVDKELLQSKFEYLRHVPIQSYENAVPQILIGLDHWNLAIPLKVKQGNTDSPIATKTKLGWVIGGPSGQEMSSCTEYSNVHQCDCATSNDDHLTDLVKSYYSTESCGVSPNIAVSESLEQRRAREILQKTTRRIGDRFETGLLWRSDDIVLPDSYPMALRRLKCLESQMSRDPTLRTKLQDQIDDYLEKGYVRKLKADELNYGPRTWFLPIFVAKNPNKPQKVRMVFDAAATAHNVSLNKMLLKGPDQMSSLLGILFRSREKPIVVGGDIRQMFHRVLIKPDDQDSQRFLWRKSENESPQQYIMSAMTFGATCSPASAQYVKNVNALEYATQFPHTYDAITKNHYVDDWFQSSDTVAEAIQLVNDVRTVHANAGFELHSIVSNYQQIVEQFGDQSAVTQKVFSSDTKTEKILGMWWDTTTDEFRFKINNVRIDESILNGRRPTKREVLRIQMSMFDPIGLIANFLIHVKILMQDIWKTGIDWDQPIKDDEFEKWSEWIEMLPLIENVSFPRSYFGKFMSTEIKSIQLHIFVDSSEKAYGAVAYLRCETPDGIRCSLVGSKSKIAPLKPMSIPRLELQAAVIGIRLANTISAEHSIQIEKKIMWTDSKTVHCWLQSDPSKFKQFVALRLSEILESSDPSNWRWISTKINVADELTKWRGIQTTSNSTQWHTGPPFLLKNEFEWPSENSSGIDKIVEQSNEFCFAMQPDVLINSNSNITNDVTVNIAYFSTWKRLIRAQSVFMRACHNFLCNKSDGDKNAIMKGPITHRELSKAMNCLYRVAQQDCYKDEIRCIRKGKTLPKTSQLYHLTPIIDEDNLLRHDGRTNVKTIILPRDHYITKLIILDCHQKFLHMNAETVVNELRQAYYITRLRVHLRQIVRDCQRCKIRNARPKPPKMAQLPPARQNVRMRPFTDTGIDFFGPLEVTMGRRMEKRYGVIFTCMTVRAVHIEVAHSLSTDSCILALRNFIHRRGRPNTIYCDNGTNFVGTKNELEKEKNRITADWAESYPTIKWKFNTPSAPHMGGAWERQVRSIKSNLFQVLPSRRTSDEVLRSVLIEVENIINSRPLVYVPLDNESDEALTPNHFLLGTSNGDPPPGEFDVKDLQLRKTWKVSQVVADHFWKRWIREYLPSITKRTKWYEPSTPIKIGDLVVIVDDQVRNSWTRGVVIDTITSPDGQVRSVIIKTAKGIYSRPTVKVAVLEVGCSNQTFPQTSEVSEAQNVQDEIPDDGLVNVMLTVNGAENVGGISTPNGQNVGEPNPEQDRV